MPMQKKRILLIGERSSGEQGYAYADSFYDILCEQGHSVLSIDGTRAVGNWIGRENRIDLTCFEKFFFDRNFNTYLLSVAKAYQPDVCFVVKGDTITASTIREIKKATDCRWVLLYPDNPFMLSNGNSNPEVIRSLQYYDIALSWAQMLIPVLKSLGVKHACYMPFGFDERFFGGHALVQERFDVGFIGTADNERVEIITNLMARLPDLSYGLWGNRWGEYLKNSQALTRAYQGPAIYKKNMVDLLKSCSVILNPVRLQNYSSHNMRSLEAAAAGVFQLATYTHEHANVLFSEGRSIALYKNTSDLAAKVTWYLQNPQARQLIAAQGRAEVQKYSLQRILDCFFENDLCFCSTLFQGCDTLEKACIL